MPTRSLRPELPAVRQGPFTRTDAARITHPALAVIGARSAEVSPIWEERQKVLLAWLPGAEPFVLPDANHLLHVQNPRGMAEGMAAFLARHSFSAR
jgi:pimeloyl-ACP methyl ester carboxylesterase